MNEYEYGIVNDLFGGLNISNPNKMTAGQCADVFWFVKTFSPNTLVSHDIIARIATDVKASEMAFYQSRWVLTDYERRTFLRTISTDAKASYTIVALCKLSDVERDQLVFGIALSGGDVAYLALMDRRCKLTAAQQELLTSVVEQDKEFLASLFL